MRYLRIPLLLLCFAALSSFAAGAQENDKHSFNKIEKLVDDILVYERLGDVAYIDKVRLAGPPKYYQARKASRRLSSWQYNPQA